MHAIHRIHHFHYEQDDGPVIVEEERAPDAVHWSVAVAKRDPTLAPTKIEFTDPSALGEWMARTRIVPDAVHNAIKGGSLGISQEWKFTLADYRKMHRPLFTVAIERADGSGDILHFARSIFRAEEEIDGQTARLAESGLRARVLLGSQVLRNTSGTTTMETPLLAQIREFETARRINLIPPETDAINAAVMALKLYEKLLRPTAPLFFTVRGARLAAEPDPAKSQGPTKKTLGGLKALFKDLADVAVVPDLSDALMNLSCRLFEPETSKERMVRANNDKDQADR